MLRLAVILCAVSASGCSFYLNAIPAHMMHPSARVGNWKNTTRVNLATLQLPQGRPYLLQAGDAVAVNASGLFMDPEEHPVPTALPNELRPEIRPATGYPFVVSAAGELKLPGIAPVGVAGATIEEAELRLRKAVGGKFNSLDLTLSLLLPRTKSILVIREDAVPSISAKFEASEQIAGTRYRGQVFDLQLAPEDSDVLTAMVRSGGLPGLDAKDELIILRRRFETDEEKAELLARLENSTDAAETAAKEGSITEVIPLRVPTGTVPRHHDVALRAGDIVLIEHRRGEVYYTGGVLSVGKYPIPRDRPLDVLQAVAIAGGTQSGLDYGGQGGKSGIASLGDATSLVPPTWVILVRQYEDRQVQFKIDLMRAQWDTSHRVMVQPGDYLHLAYRPSELFENITLKNLGARTALGFSKRLGLTGVPVNPLVR